MAYKKNICKQPPHSGPIPGVLRNDGGDTTETPEMATKSGPTGCSGPFLNDTETTGWELPEDPECWGPPPADDWGPLPAGNWEIPEWEPLDWEPLEWEPIEMEPTDWNTPEWGPVDWEPFVWEPIEWDPLD